MFFIVYGLTTVVYVVVFPFGSERLSISPKFPAESLPWIFFPTDLFHSFNVDNVNRTLFTDKNEAKYFQNLWYHDAVVIQ